MPASVSNWPPGFSGGSKYAYFDSLSEWLGTLNYWQASHE